MRPPPPSSTFTESPPDHVGKDLIHRKEEDALLLRRLPVSLDVSLQHRVDPGLVPRPFGLEPLQYFGIDPDSDRFLRLGQLGKWAFEEGVIKPGDIGVIDIPILHCINPFQVALDRFFFHVRSPFSSR